MISYELSLGLSIVGILMAFSSIELPEIVKAQGETWFQIAGYAIPKWGILLQPIGFILFITSVYAETNRLPFDLPEGESELIAGYHLEYGSLKFAMYMLGEYCNMMTASGLVVSLFFGGWQLLPGMTYVLNHLALSGQVLDYTRVAFQIFSFGLKVTFFMWLYVWVRWILPRFRYDQVMDLGWKVMLPLSLANIFLTGILIAYGVY
jgi:NADH-quinone oxidoreductase subunit H